MNKSNSLNLNPTSCKARVFLQYYSKYKVDEKRVPVEYDECGYYHKNSYSYAQVRQLLRTMKTSHSRTHNKLNLRYYKCPYCNAYHLTSRKSYQDLPKYHYAA